MPRPGLPWNSQSSVNNHLGTLSKLLLFLGVSVKGKGDCVDPLFERFGATWKNQQPFSKIKVLSNLHTYDEFPANTSLSNR